MWEGTCGQEGRCTLKVLADVTHMVRRAPRRKQQQVPIAAHGACVRSARMDGKANSTVQSPLPCQLRQKCFLAAIVRIWCGARTPAPSWPPPLPYLAKLPYPCPSQCPAVRHSACSLSHGAHPGTLSASTLPNAPPANTCRTHPQYRHVHMAGSLPGSLYASLPPCLHPTQLPTWSNTCRTPSMHLATCP